MLSIVTLNDDERKELITAVSGETGLSEAIIEKDLWVCYMLDHLFHRSEYGSSIIFKGGTSLSKAYDLIQRFSEDIDLILDWRLIGYSIDEPWEERSNTKQEKFKKETIERTNQYLADVLVPNVKDSLSKELGFEANIYPAPQEESVNFAYPSLFKPEGTLDVIRLEIGPLAAWSPSKTATISPYIAELHPKIFKAPSTMVRTSIPERTLWEKATILHQEANRPSTKRMPGRYSRHYYDMYKLINSEYADEAIGRPDLLADVVKFKERFYRTPWSKLLDAKPGTLKLRLPDYRLPELEADYKAMRPMIYGDVPPMEEVLAAIAALEDKINETSA